MNLQDFINYQKVCPICQSELNLKFRFTKQKTTITEDSANFLFDLNSLSKGHKLYKVEYCFNLHTNEISLNFYNNKLEKLDVIPIYLLNRFKEMHDNCIMFMLYKVCECGYEYSSQLFDSKYGDFSIPSLKITMEKFFFWKDFVHNYSGLIQLENNIINNTSNIINYRKNKPNSITMDISQLKIPLINFTNKEDTYERIKKLLLFS